MFLPALFISCFSNKETKIAPLLTTADLAIHVSAENNREYSYTDKKAGYYYGRTHENNFKEWFAGWNIAKRRLFSDYELYIDQTRLDRTKSNVTVLPEKLIRKFENATEEFYLFDQQELLFIKLKEIQGDSIRLHLLGETFNSPRVTSSGLVEFSLKEITDKSLFLVPASPVPFSLHEGVISTSSSGDGFIICFGNEQEILNRIAAFRKEGKRWEKERHQRMNDIIRKFNPLRSNLDSLDKSLSWLLLTTDQLVTEQQGKGIYAGLPWFNEYWGRDMFISMPGATLISGQFEVTRDILRDFSYFQDTVASSPTLGRIPNRANLEGILYNTTDGTPRFVSQIEEYVKYSGDTAFIREIYPAIALSIDAALKNYTDESGYLRHADADTWMDVKRNGIPGSPRGNRANDIQALWAHQLQAGIYFAAYMKDDLHTKAWKETLLRLHRNFSNDYVFKEQNIIADHLNEDGSADLQFRPNQLYTYELINDDSIKLALTRRIWEELVYPWGVASLSQTDDQFHPYHENWHYYHKDDAYHNGTVWLWNNGHAMQRMIELDQQDTAWKLFNNMNRQALVEGAVGSLSENADAHPRSGENWAKRSGTFLQAWSNAEQLRVWYQYFLGIRPDMIRKELVLNPRIPSVLTNLVWSERIGQGSLEGSYRKEGDISDYYYTLNNENARITLQIPLFPEQQIDIKQAQNIHCRIQKENMLVTITDANGKIIRSYQIKKDPELLKQKANRDAFFEGVDFCIPRIRNDRKVLKNYHETPLTY